MSTDPFVLEAVNRFGRIGEFKMTSITNRAETSGLSVRIAASIEALVMHFSAIGAGCREGRQIAARYHELSQLSRADLDVPRQSIAHAALNLQRFSR